MTAELDYAYLADYAIVQGGKLTAVGASFTDVAVGQLPSGFPLSIAGRIRATEDTETIPVSIKVVPPDAEYEIGIDAMIDVAGAALRPYSGKVGLLFAINFQVPVQSAGLYEVLLGIEGKQVRRLAFEVEVREG